jgi:hypothetical protein
MQQSTQHIDIPLSDLLGYMPSPVLMSAVSRATLTFLEPVGNDHVCPYTSTLARAVRIPSVDIVCGRTC